MIENEGKQSEVKIVPNGNLLFAPKASRVNLRAASDALAMQAAKLSQQAAKLNLLAQGLKAANAEESDAISAKAQTDIMAALAELSQLSSDKSPAGAGYLTLNM